MHSKYLESLSKEEYENLRKKLANIQNNKCYICQKEMDLAIQETDIDHIVPLANKGKDDIDNFALTHSSCNRSKNDANLSIARILYKLKSLQDEIQQKENRSASLKDLLAIEEGSQFDFKSRIEDNQLIYSFSEIGDNEIHKAQVFEDSLSKEKTCFIEVPLQYLYHDSLINPRGINSSISLLVKEFSKGNPQLHLTLARLNNNKIEVFDGQHKAAAQILLGAKKLLVRLFINPNVDRLIETNTNAGSNLRQIAFDKSIMRQLNNTLYQETISKYQQDHHLGSDCYDYSEVQLVDYFKGENVNIKKYIIDSIKHSITYSKDNKLGSFIDFEGKAKELPLSYSAFEKTFLSTFIDSRLILTTNISYKADEGENPRELEIKQLVKLLNIIAEEIYINKFNPEVGVARIEQKIIDKKDTDITDDHLIAYRMSKEEIIYNWLQYLKKVIENYFANTGKLYESNKLFQEPFPEQLWNNIRKFIRNLAKLPLWKNKSMASTHFAGKKNYDFWKYVFEHGSTPDGVEVLVRPINYIEMIQDEN